MNTGPDDDVGASHIALANRQVELAKQGDFQAGNEIVIQSAIAIRDFLKGDPPDEYRLIFLRALLDSLGAIEAGVDPRDALSLRKPPHRLSDPAIPMRNVLLFMLVGECLDGGDPSQHMPGFKPVETAVRKVARARNLSFTTVDKAWRDLGGEDGWASHKANWDKAD